jgi:MFS transporter, ACS family, glucarate transporter
MTSTDMIDDFGPLRDEPPMTGVRYQVLAFTVALAGVTYLDRVCIARAKGQIQADLGLTEVQMGFVFSAFTLAYAMFEIPTGAWGDRIGPRRILTRIVAWWSSFTIATASAFNYTSLLLVRFLFGMGEAGAFPNASKVISRWFPAAERGTAQGVFFAGAHLGGGLTPMLVGALLLRMNWRWIFAIFGLVGFGWAWAWYRWFRDEPADHPAVGEAERKHIESGRLKDRPHHLDARRLGRILSDRNVIALCLMYFTQAYGFYFNLTWLPTYLEKARGFTDPALGVLAGLPLILSALADLTGGLATDALVRARGLRIGRCGIGGASLLIAGVAMIAGAAAQDPLAAALLIALSGAADSFLLGAAWGTCLDIAGHDAGLVTGAMNTAGQIGAVLSPVILPYFLPKGAENWALPLYIAGVLYLAGSVCWLLIDPGRPISGADAEKREMALPDLE